SPFADRRGCSRGCALGLAVGRGPSRSGGRSVESRGEDSETKAILSVATATESRPWANVTGREGPDLLPESSPRSSACCSRQGSARSGIATRQVSRSTAGWLLTRGQSRIDTPHHCAVPNRLHSSKIRLYEVRLDSSKWGGRASSRPIANASQEREGRITRHWERGSAVPNAVYVSRIGRRLRERGSRPRDLRRRLAERGIAVSRSALDRLVSERPLDDVRLGVVLPILEEVDLDFRDAFERISAQEAEQRSGHARLIGQVAGQLYRHANEP